MDINPQKYLNDLILKSGGYVNAHSHLDRSYTVKMNDLLTKCKSELKEKWKLVDEYKKSATEEDYLNNFKRAIDAQKSFGTSVILSFVDIDEAAEYRAFNAALKAKEYAKENDVTLLLANQTLKGVVDKKARNYIESCLDDLDIIGSLPAADGDINKHFDVIMNWSKDTGKRVHSHVDQLNTILERETEQLALAMQKHNLEGMVTAVHSISLACHPKLYRQKMYGLFRSVGLSFITCPTAWIDSRRKEEVCVNHNSITPVDEMLKNDITVAIGSDNIHDIYKPFSDGNMFTELKFLLEATHTYDISSLVSICTKNGRNVLGI